MNLSFPAFIKSLSLSAGRLAGNYTGPLTLVLGNESADMDSMVSSIAMAYELSQTRETPVIPIINIARSDLALRPDCQLLLSTTIEAAGGQLNDLVFTSDFDLPGLATMNDVPELWLVDHNAPASRQSMLEPLVKGIVDHHVDEHRCLSAHTRVLEMVGSCATLVGRLLRQRQEAHLHESLARMLLAAILLDTANLSPVAQKATDADRAMVSWLFPQVQWTRDAHDITDMEFIQAPDLQAHSMAEMHKKLDKLKGQVSHLSARDLLRKDYKQWVIQSHEEGGRRWRVGISSVGYRLVKWIKRDGEDRVSAAVRDWMAEQELDLLLVMTHGKARVGKKKDGGDKVYGRDLMVVIKQAADVPVVRGLEASKDLDLSPYEYIQTDAPNTVWFYTQGKAEASRKQVFPAVKHLIESM